MPPEFLWNEKARNWRAFHQFSCRDDWIRTSDLLHPMQTRYRAALRPELRDGKGKGI